jgi:hypothetical protein
MDNLQNQKKLHQYAKKLGSHNAAISRKLEYAIINLMINPDKFNNPQTGKNLILRKSAHFKDVARKLFTY